MKKIIIISFLLILTVLIHFTFFGETDKNVTKKLDLLKTELKKDNYKTSWVIISKKRNKFVNEILPLSSKKSYHLQGNAIDIYVFDINGDLKFNEKDINIIKEKILKIEKEYPKLKGGFGTYIGHGISERMIHIDTRGYHLEW